MLYIVFGCGIVSILNMLGYDQIYSLLQFDRSAILQGQVWRLITYVFTMSGGGIFMTLILLYCYYSLGSGLERNWGTLRFNLYYFTGILLMDIYAMAFGGITISVDGGFGTQIYDFSYYYSGSMIGYLHLSMLLCFATTYPDTQFYLFFFIPIKAWILALIYLIVTLYDVISMTVPVSLFPHNLFPLVALANYFLFFGSEIANVIPLSWKAKFRRTKHQSAAFRQTGSIPFSGSQAKKDRTAAYTHRCTVCGKTDVSHPDMEFRYCSRCNGYFCYCQEHINDHTHIE